MDGSLKLPAISVDKKNHLHIGGEYILKCDKCECGRDWSHIAFWPTRGWINLCLHCAYMATDVYDNIHVLTKDEIVDIARTKAASARPSVQRKRYGPNRLTMFWQTDIVEWIRSQPQPVKITDVASHFGRKYDSVRVGMLNLAKIGVLQMTELGRFNEKAFTIKENYGLE